MAVKGGCDDFIGDFGWLTGEWLALMAARYLSRRSGGSSMHHGQPPRRF
ncbi:MAG: hypothetical protein LBB08_02390 [Rickettsiales bacterium]|nr:hypothetical protein [Rickettsiales bacterium]